MKKINWHNIRLVLIILLMVFLYSFASKRNQNRAIKNVQISFVNTKENHFLTDELVNNLLKQNLGGSFSIAKDKVDLNSVETALNNHGMIEKAEVFSSIDGCLNAQITQKTPIVRYLSSANSYYLDKNGSIMPLSSNYSARVPIVVGNLTEQNKEKYFELFQEIDSDNFLKKNITGIEILPSGNVVMKNRTYNYKIILGKPERVRQKLNNYKGFYYFSIKDTLAKKYKEVNLIFTDQVVCKK
ncbi:cell division protein FtsQ/DivIB [Flavobacterium sp.]|uniref:cell division protein FtsQ/DivIB n=1 Tax=Flavobacterium sp. TaxID=239 RepID=UPI003528464C